MSATGADRLDDGHGVGEPDEIRAEMARRLPAALQPFLTWLTAAPAPAAPYVARSARFHLVTAFAWLVLGTATTFWAVTRGGYPLLLLPAGMLATASGMGMLQAVISHHCAHGTVFRTRGRNRAMGKFISVLLLLKDFDAYQAEHMLHHSPKKLLTEEDEFLDYLTRFLGIEPGMPKHRSWRRVRAGLVSPAFHRKLLAARIRSSWHSRDSLHNAAGICVWAGVLATAAATGTLIAVVCAWVIPATLLFQAATTLRTLVEHRFPPAEVIALRDRSFVGMATAGVFAGDPVPPCGRGAAAAWAGWTLRMLTVHLFARIFVLVGDAPAHDYHHRHPASRKWASHIHERRRDAALCAGTPSPYLCTWGLVAAIDENLASIAAAAPPSRNARAYRATSTRRYITEKCSAIEVGG